MRSKPHDAANPSEQMDSTPRSQGIATGEDPRRAAGEAPEGVRDGVPVHRGDSVVPPWVVTKLRPPVLRDRILVRPRILSIINDALASGDSLVLVSAPAGSGKSTAVASWANEETKIAVTWMHVDEGDNDPVRFWGALVAGLAEHQPAILATVMTPLQTPKVSFIESVLPALVFALDAAEETVIVLDDYHLITDHELHAQVSAFIDACPAHVAVVMSTRIDPPLHLGRLRVRGQLSEIRARDLRFDAAEAATMFDRLDVSSAEIELMCERTEGWAAGLVLAALSLSRSPDPANFVKNFAGDNRMVHDYLTTELWDTLPDDVRDVFVNVSMLDTMCGPLVDALMESHGRGAAWLEEAAHDNQLVIALDQHGGWYRYHQLLRDLLRSTLNQEHADRLPVLHARAAQWYADNGDETSAIGHALDGGDTVAAADLIATHGSKVCSEGKLVTVQAWLARLGEATVATDPALSVLLVQVMAMAGDWARIDRPIETARQLLTSGVVEPEAAAMLTGPVEAAATLSEIARGDIGKALQTIESVAAQREQYDTAVAVRAILGMALTWRGASREAVGELEWAAAVAPEAGEHLIAASSLLFLAINACANDDASRADHYARAALDHAEKNGLSEYHQLALAHSVLARTTAPDDASEQAARGVSKARRSKEPITLAFALVAQAERLLVMNAADDARRALVEARGVLERCADPGTVLTMLARAEARLGGARLVSSSTYAGIPDPLTNREVTVLRLLPSRLSVREIACELCVSQNTVKGHVKAVYRKLGVRDRSVAVQRAREMNLL